GVVDGWDDPRMPTLAGMRRRGYPPEAIRNFCERVGVAKRNSVTEVALLEFSVRETLNKTAPRRMAVLDPLKVTIRNYPEGETEELEAINNPEDESAGTRMVPFARELYIERADFMEDPPKKFFRLAPGREVRLRYAYYITCEDVVKNDAGEVVELICSYDPETKGGSSPDGRKVKATLHWVAAPTAVSAEVRLYDRLFDRPDPLDVPDDGDFLESVNPDSLSIVKEAKLEPALAETKPDETVQFERLGYFRPDAKNSSPDALVFNRTATLRDSWAKIEKNRNQQPKKKK
ncbi:MAG: glutamine--tRNA ligase, partial [Ignavibacteriales bacterium]|nr:glutamine--tRNA ligase [Ignavibacteriales bacterium]